MIAATALLLATLTDQQRATHALNRLAFGPRPGDVERVMKIGVDRWVEQQLQPENIADEGVEKKLDAYPTLDLPADEIVEKFYKPIIEARRQPERNEDAMKALQREGRQVTEDLMAQRILRAADSNRQLNEVMVDFWMNHFNVFIGKGADRFLLTSYERDTIRPRIWGNFEDLLMATAKSPAMLFYLDNARSRKGGINENYAREIMELHTLGVDGGYTQKDVTELARVFTGWSIARPREGSGFMYRRNQHDKGDKTVLGIRIAAGGGIEEGERMVRYLANHPSTARHIAYKLCQRLVADEPPAALVDRVAKRFRDTRGDLRQTVKAVIDSPEFWEPKNYRAKMKSPFEYAISAVRAVDGRVTNPLPIARELRKIGQPLYGSQPPTGYSETADAWNNSGALMNRLNFALALAANKMPGVKVTLPAEPASIVELTEQTRKAIAERRADGPEVAAALVLGSPEFQRQ
jgi:uncharacterized protein (DUF1800 family)